MARQPLNELLYTTFYTLLKAANVAPSIDRMEMIQKECDRLSKRIENEIKLSVIEKIEKLQAAIIPAFQIIEERIEILEGKTKLQIPHLSGGTFGSPNDGK